MADGRSLKAEYKNGITFCVADAVIIPTKVDIPVLIKLSVSVVPVTLMPETVVSSFLLLLKKISTVELLYARI